MKKNNMNIGLIFIFLIFYNSTLFATMNLKDLGTSGRVEITAGTLSSNNNFIPINNENEKIDSLDGTSDNESTLFYILPAFELNHNFKKDLKIYIGSQFNDGYRQGNTERDGLTLGVEQSFMDKSILDISIFAGFGPTWENPYIITEDRKDTFYTNSGLHALYKNILGTGFLTSYKVMAITVNEDELGKEIKELKRTGIIQTLRIGYTFSIADHHFITPGFYYSKGIFDGESNDFNRYLSELTYTFETKNHIIGCALNYDTVNFDNVHPQFNKKNDSENSSLRVFYTKENLFHTQGFYSTIHAGYYQTSSNIDFYDSESLKIGVGMGFNF